MRASPQGSVVAARLVALGLLFALVVPALADPGCRSGTVTVWGRRAADGHSDEPRVGVMGGAFLSVSGGPHVDDHVLLPGIDQLVAHYHKDLGPGVPTVTVTLDGLGLANATFTLYRTAILGGFRYDMAAAADLPAPAYSGSVNASVGADRATYRVLTVP